MEPVKETRKVLFSLREYRDYLIHDEKMKREGSYAHVLCWVGERNEIEIPSAFTNFGYFLRCH